jgi:hypothetical protein
MTKKGKWGREAMPEGYRKEAKPRRRRKQYMRSAEKDTKTRQTSTQKLYFTRD